MTCMVVLNVFLEPVKEDETEATQSLTEKEEGTGDGVCEIDREVGKERSKELVRFICHALGEVQSSLRLGVRGTHSHLYAETGSEAQAYPLPHQTHPADSVHETHPRGLDGGATGEFRAVPRDPLSGRQTNRQVITGRDHGWFSGFSSQVLWFHTP